MKPFRKPFFGDPLFPFEIVHQATKHPQYELPDHLHDRYELVYVYSGHGTFFIDNRFYDKKPGDLFLIPGNTIHQAFPDAGDPIVSTALFFAPAFPGTSTLEEGYAHLGCYERARRRKRYKLEPPEELRASIEELLSAIDLEMKQRLPGYREAVRLSLCRLLLLLNRSDAAERRRDEPAAAVTRVGPPWIMGVLQTIDEHPEEDVGLSTLAERAGVTPAHFSRVFKQLTGLNVTDYVNAKRIIRAKEMLRETDESVGAIADRCGFESLPHFHRTFKSIAGMTPGAYRRGWSGGQS